MTINKKSNVIQFIYRKRKRYKNRIAEKFINMGTFLNSFMNDVL